MKYAQLNIVKRNLNELKPHPKNPRIHPEIQMRHLARSIDKFSYAKGSICVQKDTNLIIAGHAIRNSLLKKGFEEADVIELDFDDIVALQFLVADNKTSDDSGWNLKPLKEIIKELDAFPDVDLRDTGFELQELDELFSELIEQPEETFDIVEALEDESKPITKTGDIWTANGHRWICGDSTKEEDVERLIGGKKADMVLTSPPYWNQRNYSFWETFEMYLMDMTKVWSNIKKRVLKDNGILFWNIGDDSSNHVHISAHHSIGIENTGFVYIDSIVWKKPGVTGIRLAHQKTHNKYYPGFCFELLLVFKNGDGKFPTFETKWKKDLPLTNVWELRTEGTLSKKHPAPFPTELPEIAIKCYTEGNDNIVYDPFLGAGTTLIACEKLGRQCVGIEIEPRYIDVICKRYFEFTNQIPVREADKFEFPCCEI